MHFDVEAIRGIYEALPDVDRRAVLDYLPKLYNPNLPSMERVEKVGDALIALGYILPFEQPKMDWAAKEYDEAMAAMELLGGETDVPGTNEHMGSAALEQDVSVQGSLAFP